MFIEINEQYAKARQSMLISQILTKKENTKKCPYLVLERYFAGEILK